MSPSSSPGAVPAPPRPSWLARVTMPARTSSGASGRPALTAWLRSKFHWKRSRSAGSIARSRSAPTPVVAPYKASPRSSSAAIASRAASFRERAAGASVTRAARRATASTAAGVSVTPSSTIESVISIASRGCQ